MKMLTVSEAALDSIQRMGEADKARIEQLNVIASILWRLLDKGFIHTWDEESEGECAHLRGLAHDELKRYRVSTDAPVIAKGEN